MAIAPWQPSRAARLIVEVIKEVDKAYVLGSEGPPEAHLHTWDCSELVQHGLAWAGVTQVTNDEGLITPVSKFDGAWFQWERSRKIALDAGIKTPGALLFAKTNPDRPHGIGHVAISLGNGYIVEARGVQYGVVIGRVRPSFTLATKVPELYCPAT